MERVLEKNGKLDGEAIAKEVKGSRKSKSG
jgi:hypothetical protein